MNRPDATPLTDQISVDPSILDLFRNRQSASPMHRPIPAPEPNPEPNPGPDAATRTLHNEIAPKDWDELFLAIQVRLKDCVADAQLKLSDVELHDQRMETRTVVLECIQAMQQLQAALASERGNYQHHRKVSNGHSEG